MTNPNCYHSDTTTAAYSLRWSWTGWPSIGSMPSLTENDWRELADAWEKDGIRLLERNCLSDYWQATVSTKPATNPSFIVGRIKGRIDHRFRSQKIPFIWSWSSKVGVGSATSSFWGTCLKSAKRSPSCRKLGVVGLWRPSYYVGTTGAYNMNAVRGRTPWASDGTSPSGSPSS